MFNTPLLRYALVTVYGCVYGLRQSRFIHVHDWIVYSVFTAERADESCAPLEVAAGVEDVRVFTIEAEHGLAYESDYQLGKTFKM